MHGVKVMKVCGKDYCRACKSSNLFSALDLGNLPIANELVRNQSLSPDVFPLHLRICKECGLGQVEDVVSAERLFQDYRYLSSMSASFLDHANQFAKKTIEEVSFSSGDWVLEIASNDGYLLKYYIELGINVLGVEPAVNIASIAAERGVPTINEFFTASLARELLSTYGTPKLIIANNVMAHVPDLRDFVEGLAILAGPSTILSVENPSLMNFILGDQFDSIYHEHFSYLTAHSVKLIALEHGLELFNVEDIETHGGSNRYWLRKTSGIDQKFSIVEQKISMEIEFGLLREEVWQEFSDRIRLLIQNFKEWVEELHLSGRVLCGYGAAAKASTLINASHIQKDWIRAIADSSPEKQGWFMPSLGIPIISSQDMKDFHPSDIIVFPWNLSVELTSLIRKQFDSTLKIWIAVPQIIEMK
jgi:2-polyprenyl-3-methyl-5-hydroxy-6-metoxy-1,4-benzoquinol methylase